MSSTPVMLEAGVIYCLSWLRGGSLSSQGDLQSTAFPGRSAIITEVFKEPSQRSENRAPYKLVVAHLLKIPLGWFCFGVLTLVEA